MFKKIFNRNNYLNNLRIWNRKLKKILIHWLIQGLTHRRYKQQLLIPKLRIKKENRSLYKCKSIYLINLEFRTNKLERTIFINPIANHLTKSLMDKSCRVKSSRRQFSVKRPTKNQTLMRDNNKIIVLFVGCWISNVIRNTAIKIRSLFILTNSILITNGLTTVGLYKETDQMSKNKSKFRFRILRMMMINFKC